ncbi:phosphonate ABC transporter, permease PhnE [Mycobacterium [tuberculosis] TKK-01-0051]|uniref:Phosphonate ABC transporter, permease PhnE n=1 Tax=Mycobacterium [tuberculosis] TKK-01-0051 TaxID=1324261 RepID=A0A051TVM2_9MYCO|nr:phosphonate ABC transporter, permease protein PhnE [Mycobacterium colombiense]KBZ60728.1 phosphonate ABC transporter, permease PhnE [Mycobacterium [tuberculosis] TKK-01-0051]
MTVAARRIGLNPGSVNADYAAIVRLEQRRRIRFILLVVAVAAVVLGCCAYVGLLDARRLSDGVPALLSLIGEMWPPDFSRAGSWLAPLLDTVAMSVAGTFIAIALSFPLGLAAARNTTPHPIVYHVARTILNGLRAVPELIMGIVFVAAVGFGALPGVLALGLHSVGMVGKFYAEAIEHVSPAPVEAARAVGARPVQVIAHGFLPQVLPQLADVSIYRWEYNFRASTVLGLVGAGGIGFQLMAALRVLEYRQVFAIMLVILGTVTVVDGISGWLRRRFA